MKTKTVFIILFPIILVVSIIGMLILGGYAMSLEDEGDFDIDPVWATEQLQLKLGMQFRDAEVIFARHYDHGIDNSQEFILQLDDFALEHIQNDSSWEMYPDGEAIDVFMEDIQKNSDISITRPKLLYRYIQPTDEEGLPLGAWIYAFFDSESKILNVEIVEW